jgi:hypothetical protein
VKDCFCNVTKIHDELLIYQDFRGWLIVVSLSLTVLNLYMPYTKTSLNGGTEINLPAQFIQARSG